MKNLLIWSFRGFLFLSMLTAYAESAPDLLELALSSTTKPMRLEYTLSDSEGNVLGKHSIEIDPIGRTATLRRFASNRNETGQHDLAVAYILSVEGLRTNIPDSKGILADFEATLKSILPFRSLETNPKIQAQRELYSRVIDQSIKNSDLSVVTALERLSELERLFEPGKHRFVTGKSWIEVESGPSSLSFTSCSNDGLKATYMIETFETPDFSQDDIKRLIKRTSKSIGPIKSQPLPARLTSGALSYIGRPDHMEITDVVEGSWADKSGLKKGDHILRINEVDVLIKNKKQFLYLLRMWPQLKLLVLRNGKQVELTVDTEKESRNQD